MGLLDDAIRQHLELKRRHGAGEDEVRRQEQEALGPPRRGEVPQPLSPPGEESSEAEVSSPAEGGGAPPAPAPVEDRGLDEPIDDLGPATGDRRPGLEEPAEEPPAAYAAPQPGDVEAGDPNADDVLEETPEFLQETPEHDRLWFEQKPPKDFDFDK